MNQKVVRMGLAASALGGVIAVLTVFVAPVQAGLLDNILGTKTDLGPTTQRAWRLDQYSSIKLVDKETGVPSNQHPAKIEAAALATQLKAVEVNTRDGFEPLFADEELSDLVPVMARALSLAKPTDDVLLLSTARRGGRFSEAEAITARLFVQGDALNVVVNDARLSFLQQAKNSRVDPKFIYGSRTHMGGASLKSESATSKRGDWVAIPVASLAGAPVAVPAAPTAAVAPRPTPAVAVMPAPAAVPTPPPAPGSPAAAGEEIEQRLITLKRLRDKNLISEEEYQQKRREVLQKL